MLGYLIGFDEEFYEQTQGLLLEFGMDLNNMAACKDVFEANFDSACYHDNHYHSVDFGNATVKDFVSRWADLIEAAAARHDLSAEIQPALHIMRSGNPDWLVYRRAFTSLDETLGYMRRFVAVSQDNPQFINASQTADQLFKEASITSKSLAS